MVSLTRSALLGAAIGLLILLGVSRRSLSTLIFVVTIMAIALFAVFAVLPLSSRLFYLDVSALSRLPLFKANLLMAMRNPLGVGAGRSVELASEYYFYVSNMLGAELVGVKASHNHFLNVTVNWGWIAAVLEALFYYKVFKATIYCFKNSYTPFLKGLALGLISFLVSSVIQSSFHNAGFFSSGGDSLWLIIGILNALCNVIQLRVENTNA